MKLATLILVLLLCVDAVTWFVFVGKLAGVIWLALALTVAIGARKLEAM